MEFSISKSIEILERTPKVLSSMLDGLSSEWTESNEGENTWTAKEIVAHLIICEKTNWLTRMRVILSESPDKPFIPIDMQAHFELSKNQSTKELLQEFMHLRENSIEEIRNLHLEDHLSKTGNHPTLGTVPLQQIFATWVTHDLSHIAQISRVLAKQNKEHVGPFETFLRILKS